MANGLQIQPDPRKATLAARHRALADLHARGGHLVKCHSEASAAAANAKLKAAGKEETATFKGPVGRWKKHPASLGAAQRHNGPVGVIAATLGCVVVDMDSGGAAARQEVISLLRRPLAQVDTHRDGGSHLWYRSQHAAKIGNGKFLFGDIRGNDKGYAILWDAELVAAGLASSESLVNLNEADLARLLAKFPPNPSSGGGAPGGRNIALNKGVFLATCNGEPIEPHVAAARKAGLSEPEIAATVASAQKAGVEARANSGDVLAFPSDLSPHGLHKLWLATNGEDWRYLIAGTSSTGTWAHWTGARYKQVSEVYAFRDVSKLVAQVADSASRGDGADKRRAAVRSMKNSAFTVDVSKFNRATALTSLRSTTRNTYC